VIDLSGKNVVVTGASRGIGRAIAIVLAEAGAKVAVTATTLEAAQKTAREITDAGREAIAFAVDVADGENVKEMVASAVKELGTIHVFINNAGITRDNLFVRMSETDWNQVVGVNLTGVYHCIKAIAKPMMRKRVGKIINITSIVGQTGNPGQANYSAAKAGIVGMTKSLAKELSARNIQLNCIAPGYIETDMTRDLPSENKEQLLSMIPAGRMGHPEDVANLAAFLASDLSNYITGQVFNVDGGMVM